MPLGTLDRAPPPFFRQGPSALSKLLVFGALAVFLMVADVRFKVMQPVRIAFASVLYPVQWLAMQPIQSYQRVSQYFATMSTAQSAQIEIQIKFQLQSQRANQGDQLALENARLRQLLGLRERLQSPAVAAQVIYDAADPYSRKVVIDRGLVDNIALGSPVLDESGVLGQVTRVYPILSEVTLLTDRDQAIPVLNTRTGARGVAYGDHSSAQTEAMDLRFMAANADVAEGDLLTTSGVDGVYPPGLPVAKVERVERRVDAAFARIYLVPVARVAGSFQVLVLEPINAQIPARPAPEVVTPAPTRRARSPSSK